MLMKLLVNVFERARSKLTVTHVNDQFSSESDLESSDHDHKSSKFKSSSSRTSITQHQPRSSLSKWLCTTPVTSNKSITGGNNRVRRSSSWRSLRERGTCSINSRTYSVDELHRNHSQFNRLRRRDVSQSPLKTLHSHSRRKLSNEPPSHTRFDRLSSNLIDYSKSKKKKKSSQQQIVSTLSHHSNGADSGYSEESFLTTSRTCQRPLHTSCPHCHCEQRSSFNSYQKLPKPISSSDSSPSDLPKSYENLSHTQPRKSFQPRPNRTLQEKRRRNLSCDGSLWSRAQQQQQHKAITVYSEPSHQRHLTTTTIQTQPMMMMMNSYTKTLPNSSNVFGELNLAAIELDSLRTSFSSSTYSSSSSIQQEKRSSRKPQQQLFLVWHEYESNSLLSQTTGTKPFSVRRGDQVRLLKRMGKSTLLVQKDDDGSIGFLPQTCLTHHPINSFLSLKGLRETVL